MRSETGDDQRHQIGLMVPVAKVMRELKHSLAILQTTMQSAKPPDGFQEHLVCHIILPAMNPTIAFATRSPPASFFER